MEEVESTLTNQEFPKEYSFADVPDRWSLVLLFHIPLAAGFVSSEQLPSRDFRLLNSQA